MEGLDEKAASRRRSPASGVVRIRVCAAAPRNGARGRDMGRFVRPGVPADGLEQLPRHVRRDHVPSDRLPMMEPAGWSQSLVASGSCRLGAAGDEALMTTVSVRSIRATAFRRNMHVKRVLSRPVHDAVMAQHIYKTGPAASLSRGRWSIQLCPVRIPPRSTVNSESRSCPGAA
jgi:hypothetical protein